MCGEDGTQKMVYKLKEEHVKGGIGNIRERKKAQIVEEEQKKNRRTVSSVKTKTIVAPTRRLVYP